MIHTVLQIAKYSIPLDPDLLSTLSHSVLRVSQSEEGCNQIAYSPSNRL